MDPLQVAADAGRVQIVRSFEALLTVPLARACNGICWQRDLAGDFEEVARRLATDGGVTGIDDASFDALDLSTAGRTAVKELQADLRRLREAGHVPEINCVEGYARDSEAVLPTDVYSFHVDSATEPTETFLCSYTGLASEGVIREEARLSIEIPEVRARLLEGFGGKEDRSFAEYLRERHFDLHYTPLPHARPFSFGVGNLWRLAVQYPGAPTSGFIHRAPATESESSRRLMLIS